MTMNFPYKYDIVTETLNLMELQDILWNKVQVAKICIIYGNYGDDSIRQLINWLESEVRIGDYTYTVSQWEQWNFDPIYLDVNRICSPEGLEEINKLEKNILNYICFTIRKYAELDMLHNESLIIHKI